MKNHIKRLNEMNQIDKQNLKNMYLDKTIRIKRLSGEDGRYAGKEGTVTYIDDIGQLHGTWGGLAVIPEIDEFYVINDLANKDFETTNNINGTSNVAYIDCTYDELVNVFGEPTKIGDFDKTTCEWHLKECSTGTVFTIYDYKSSVPYKENELWSVGGHLNKQSHIIDMLQKHGIKINNRFTHIR